jgi:hypothetical protein
MIPKKNAKIIPATIPHVIGLNRTSFGPSSFETLHPIKVPKQIPAIYGSIVTKVSIFCLMDLSEKVKSFLELRSSLL